MAALPKSLLSFLYNVTYDPDVKDRFHSQPDLVMQNDFGLSQEIRDVMRQLGDQFNQGGPGHPSTQQLLDQLASFIQEELSTDISPTFW